MKIKVLFTGGTIGSSVGGGAVISTDPAAGRLLLKNFFENGKTPNKTRVTFLSEEPYTCLSEDMTVANWNLLLAALRNTDFTDLDGVIITHGTDTLAYTANLLAAALGGVSVPVLVLGSNYVLTDPRADGNLNFEAAVDFIAAGGHPGVFAVSQGVIHLGSRVLQCRPFLDRFESANGVPYARYENGALTFVPDALNPTGADLTARAAGPAPLLARLPALRPDVYMLCAYVGLDYGGLLPDRDIKAVLHGLYHSSTACVGDADRPGKHSILTLCEACRERGIALFIAPFKQDMLEDGARYATTDILMGKGVGFCCDMSQEAAYAKLLCATALFGADGPALQSFMNENLFFEHLV